MNYSEYLNYQDSGMLDGAYRIIVAIREDAKLGLVGHLLKKKYCQRIECIHSIAKSVNSIEAEFQIDKWIAEINKYLSWES